MNEYFDFVPGMKVFLDGEYGVITNDFWESGLEQKNLLKNFGLIRWDTEEEVDFEDWRGMHESFKNLGGIGVSSDHTFKFINDDGTMKKDNNYS